MKKIIVYIAAVGMMAVMSCGGSGSGKRQPSPRKNDSTKAVIPSPKQDVDPGFSIGDKQGKPIEIIGVPMSVAYAISLRSWNLSLKVNSRDGLAYGVEIDSATANTIINDHSIVAVKVTGKKVILLRE